MKEAILNVEVSNAPALGLYRRHGFEDGSLVRVLLAVPPDAFDTCDTSNATGHADSAHSHAFFCRRHNPAAWLHGRTLVIHVSCSTGAVTAYLAEVITS